MRRLMVALLLAGPIVVDAQNVLLDSDHAVNQLNADVPILNGSVNPPYVDQTCMTGYSNNLGGGLPVNANGCFTYASGSYSEVYTPTAILVPDSTNTGASLFAGATATASNHAPYSIMSTSYTGYSIEGDDQVYYNTLSSNDQISVWPFCGGDQINGYPGVVTSSILSLTGGSQCGPGLNIEFSMSNAYDGFDTVDQSAASVGLAAIYAVIKKNHSSWHMADIKAALRQTASSWSSGYAETQSSPTGYGYGNVNFSAANALSGTSAIYLQAPGMTIHNLQSWAQITLYPFVTTRRAKEVVYAGGTWPNPNSLNEMTAAQIAAAGGTKILDDGGNTGAQTYTYVPGTTGSVTFTAITLDSSGNGSRVESFSQIPESFIVGTGCQSGTN